MNKTIDTFWDARTVFARRFAMVVIVFFGVDSLSAEPMESAKAIAPVNAANFRTDVTAGGSINGTDVSAVKANSGHGVP